MVAYALLELEQEWRDEFLSPQHEAFNTRMGSFFSAAIGSKGDNEHLYGRHRSRFWDLGSRYCTDRSYATQDGRDLAGDGDLIRATDIGISGPTHWAAARRLDAAVRAGQLPCVAEWFGTFDGQTVVGWFEGDPSSADDSHLTHLHVGLWTQYCTNAAQLQLLGNVITGTGGTDMPYLVNIKSHSEVWVSDGTWRHRLDPGFANLFNQMTARFGPPWVVNSEAELEYVAGRDVATVGDGSGDGGVPELIRHTHDGGMTGPAVATPDE